MCTIHIKYFCVFLAVLKSVSVEAADYLNMNDISSLHSGRLASSRPCEVGWFKYSDQKCLKIFNNKPVKQIEYIEAKTFCKEDHRANLVSITSQEKQLFLERYLQYKEVSLNVWIGLEHKMNAIYEWSDGTQLAYKNWATGSPNNRSGYCVQMQVDKEKFGNWSDILCTAKNLVMCEKMQLWSPYRQQKIVMNMLSIQLIPVGFIFFQLPSQKPPTEIWPTLTWKDVSADYQSTFFRVFGGLSDSFGSTQGGSTTRLTRVAAYGFSSWDYDSIIENGTGRIPVGDASPWMYTGKYPKSVIIKDYHTLSFSHSGGEVRPRNMAIRVWKRV